MKNIYNSLYQPDVVIYSTKHRCWAETQKIAALSSLTRLLCCFKSKSTDSESPDVTGFKLLSRFTRRAAAGCAATWN